VIGESEFLIRVRTGYSKFPDHLSRLNHFPYQPTQPTSATTLSSRAGLPRWGLFVVPPSLLPDVLNFQPFKLQAVLTLSARHPSQATLARRLGCIGGSTRDFSRLRLVALLIHLTSVLDIAKACLAYFFGAGGSVHLSR